MKPTELPLLRAGDWRAITLEPAELAGTQVWAVTCRCDDRPARRRWFPSEDAALCYAADQADALGLPLIDLRHGGENGEG